MKASKEWAISLKPGITSVQKSRNQRDTDFTFYFQGAGCEKVSRHPGKRPQRKYVPRFQLRPKKGVGMGRIFQEMTEHIGEFVIIK